MWIVIAIGLVVYGLIASGLGVATNPNKRFPEEAKADEWLYVAVVVLGLPFAVLMLLI